MEPMQIMGGMERLTGLRYVDIRILGRGSPMGGVCDFYVQIAWMHKVRVSAIPNAYIHSSMSPSIHSAGISVPPTRQASMVSTCSMGGSAKLAPEMDLQINWLNSLPHGRPRLVTDEKPGLQ